jgi:hypothetical protein
MVMAGTPQDQELMAEGKDFCLQNEASSEPISQEEEEEGEHGSERLHIKAFPQLDSTQVP